MAKKKSFIQDLFSVFVSRGLSLSLGLLTSIITARYLGPKGNGIVAAVSVYPSLFMALGALGIQQSTTYFVGQKKYDLQKLYSSVLFVWLFTTLLCFATSYVLIRYFTSNDYSLYIILLAILPIPFSLYSTYTSGIFLGKQEIGKFNQTNWIPALINCVLSFVFLGILKMGDQGALLALLIGAIALAAIIFININKIVVVKPRFDKQIVQGLLTLGGIYAITTLIASLNYKVDIVLLEKWSTQEELGIYSKGATLVEMMWQIPSILSTIIFSRSANAENRLEFSQKVCSLLRFSLIFLFGVGIVLYFLSKYIIVLMYGEAFLGSSNVFIVLIPGVFIMVIYKILYMDVAGRGMPWKSMESMIPAIIANVILNYFLIPKYGAVGASISSTISYAVAGLSFIFVYSKLSNISIKEIFTFTQADKLLVRNFVKKLVKR